jgi:hypothetical protein
MSSAANPFYNPDWAQLYQLRRQDDARWEMACGQIAAEYGFASPKHLAAMAQHREVKTALAAALMAQHKTICDYAAWRFSALPAPKDGVALILDFDEFETIAAVDEAFQRAANRQAENPFLNEMSLPVRQPAGLAAFAAAETVLSSWRRFEIAELGPYQNSNAEAFLDCLVSFQQLDETLHFCVAHRWGGLSPQSQDQFRNIATVLARQALAFSIPGAEIIFADGQHNLLEHRELIRQVNERAKRFYFYRHLLPRRDLKEQFCRVDMTWNGTRFIDPDFSAGLYEALPAVLRAATEREFKPAAEHQKMLKQEAPPQKEGT